MTPLRRLLSIALGLLVLAAIVALGTAPSSDPSGSSGSSESSESSGEGSESTPEERLADLRAQAHVVGCRSWLLADAGSGVVALADRYVEEAVTASSALGPRRGLDYFTSGQDFAELDRAAQQQDLQVTAAASVDHLDAATFEALRGLLAATEDLRSYLVDEGVISLQELLDDHLRPFQDARRAVAEACSDVGAA